MQSRLHHSEKKIGRILTLIYIQKLGLHFYLALIKLYLFIHEIHRVLIYGDLGNFSITGIEINFKRHSVKYLYVYYLPSGLFVVVSWVSFLVPPEIIPGRMAMLVTLFLVLTNIFNVSKTILKT